MGKSVIAPIIGFLIVASQILFGIEVPQEVGGQVTDLIISAISLGTVIYGIIKSHNKPQDGENSGI